MQLGADILQDVSDAPCSGPHGETLPRVRYPAVVIGAGPAGLTAAYELTKQGTLPLILEQSGAVGGLARTEVYKGYRFDIGGHRFYTKLDQIHALWTDMLGKDFRKVPRLSRIYYRGRFFKYPLDLFDTICKLGVVESALIVLSYLGARLRPLREERTFDQWVTNRFGARLYRAFFKTYTEKVWGMPCDRIQADWAAQRIRGLSIATALVDALFGYHRTKTLIREFHYPALGPGMMWQRFQDAIVQQGGAVLFNAPVRRIRHKEGGVVSITIPRRLENGVEVCEEIVPEQVISSMPMTDLIQVLDPPPPPEVRDAAAQLSFRGLIVVGLIVNRAELFPDNWIYVHSPDVRVGRIQNPKNWSPDLVPNEGTSSLAMEYFCTEADALWRLSDQQLVAMARHEVAVLGFAREDEVTDGTVFRQPKAYPVYDTAYRQHVEVIQQYLAGFHNLQTIGRNGMHRYNNQDHSMVTGMLAVRNLGGARHDLWSVNTERAYYEEEQG